MRYTNRHFTYLLTKVPIRYRCIDIGNISTIFSIYRPLYHGRDRTKNNNIIHSRNEYLDSAESPPWYSSTQSSDRTADIYVLLPSTSAIYDPTAQIFQKNGTGPP